MFTCLSLHLSSQMKRPADDLPPANTKAAKANAKATATTVAAKAKAKATATTVAATAKASAAASPSSTAGGDDAPLISLAPSSSSSSSEGGGKGAKGGGTDKQWVEFLAVHAYKKVKRNSKFDQSATGLGMVCIEEEGGGTFDWEHTDDEGIDDEEVLAAWYEWMHG